MIRVEPVSLPDQFGDDEGMLVFRDDVLLAVLSRLGDLHGDMEGRWHIEAYFAGLKDPVMPDTFESLDEAKDALQA